MRSLEIWLLSQVIVTLKKKEKKGQEVLKKNQTKQKRKRNQTKTNQTTSPPKKAKKTHHKKTLQNQQQQKTKPNKKINHHKKTTYQQNLKLNLTICSMVKAIWNCVVILSIFIFKSGDGCAYFGCRKSATLGKSKNWIVQSSSTFFASGQSS